MIKKKGAPDCINYTGENQCRCLSEGHCFEKCSFYKTKEQYDKAIERVFAGLRELPGEMQLMIADKYYKGKTVWHEKNNKV